MFRRKRAEISVSVSEGEADLLRRIVNEYLQLLASESPDAEVMKRLYPDASADDEQVRATYRDLAHDSLADHKRNTAGTALRTLGSSGAWNGKLNEEELEAWMVLLTDLRLVIGVRLGVDEEMMAVVPDPNDAEQWPLGVIHYLAYLQETLIEASSK